MKHIIVGTAGHIDHGKTTLIKALTGVNTDRLGEEQKRGISIDLGFSHFDLSETERIGIIDVPGHEKFLKNMLAGVAGMDLVMLIVGADEGVMPQTREHLDILELIGQEKGIVVITKIDKVEEDFLELVEEDIRESIKGTFLENAPYVLVDSVSGKGIDRLKEVIQEVADQVEGKNDLAPARVFIDRIFSVKGFGSVVTGTLVEGTIKPDDELVLYPSGSKVKVRGVQVHGQKAEAGYAGQRVAINLAGIDKEKIERGDSLAAPNSMTPTMMIDCKIRVLETAPKDVEHWDRVRVYHGAKELLGRIVPLENQMIQRGHEGYVQIRLEESLSCKTGDKIILRAYSPMETIGGGTILDANAKKHSHADEDMIETFQVKEQGEPKDIAESYLMQAESFVDRKEINEKLSIADPGLKEIQDQLQAEGKILVFGNQLIHQKNMEQLAEKSLEVISSYHKQNSLRKGISREEFKSRMKIGLRTKDYDQLIEELVERIHIVEEGALLRRSDFQIVYTEEEAKIKEEILARLAKEGLEPSLVKDYIDSDKKEVVAEGMLEQGLIIKVSEELYYDRQTVEKLEEEVKEILTSQGELTMNDIRDRYGLSRKFSIALLEYFDRIRLTRRVGDKRLAF